MINAKIRIHNIFFGGVLLLWRRVFFLSGGLQSLCLGESTFEVEWCKICVYEGVLLLWRRGCF